MEATRTGPREDLTRFGTGTNSTGFWGIILLVMIESTVFAGLIASYFYLFSNVPVWPPDGIEAPDLLIPIVNLVIILASVVPAFSGDRALARGDVSASRLWFAIGTVLLIVFLVLRYIEFTQLNVRWDEHAYGSIVWFTLAFHSAHASVVLVKTIATQVLLWRGFFNRERRSAVQGTTLYWAFVAIVFIPVFATIYYFPHS